MARKRRTRQQTAIEAIFDNCERPLTPLEIQEMAKEAVPNLGMATVYRTLNHMLEDGVLKIVDIPGQSSRYEKAGKEHHHHFHCTSCNRVFDLQAPPLPSDIEIPEGYVVKSHDITLSGTCSDCGE